MNVKDLHLQYVNEKYDENGVLSEYVLNVPEDFNFAYDVVDKIAELEPDRTAMMWVGENGEEHRFSFADIKLYSDKTAEMLQKNGIKKGDMVMLVLKRHYHFWFSIMACQKLGAVAIPATHLLTVKDFVYRFEAASVKAIICTSDGDVTSFVDKAAEKYSGLACKFLVRCSEGSDKKELPAGWIDFNGELERCAGTFDIPASRSDDPMLLYFTSGTTGNPKMVLHYNSYAIGHLITAKHWQNVRPDGLHFTISDTGWGKAVWGKLYGQWLLGAGVFTYDFNRFDSSVLLPMFKKYSITTFCAPPTMFRFFIKEKLSKFDLSSLEYVTIAGEALNPEVFNQFYEHTGLKLMEGFGQTETTLLIANLTNMEPRPGSMGKPVPQYNVLVVDEDGNPVPSGTTGEIVVSSEPVPVGLFSGYHLDEALTNRAWHDGLYHTGDTAWVDEDGYFWYVGRTDDIIKSSGYRIGPFEIESTLMEHPAVLECAVTGVPDEERGQVVKATIVLAQGYAPSDELAAELQNHVKKCTAPYKYPRVVEFIEELPKTISGKIKRAEIRGDMKK